MKKFLLIFAITASLMAIVVPIVVTSTPPTEANIEAAAERVRQRKLDTKHQERIARRKARQEAFEHFIDSTVLTHNFRFTPTMFNVEPAGSSHMITNPNIELSFYSDWADVHLPIYQGFTPPYRLILVNSAITSLTDFVTVQTDNGWRVTFSSWLYTSNDYTFTLDIYSKTGGATLSVGSDFSPTTSYWGSISPLY